MRAATHALLALAAVAAAARPAAAAPYEATNKAFIDAGDQADLDDLLAAGEITQDTYDELLALLEVGVELSTADRALLSALPNLTYDDVDRILAYRDAHGGRIANPAALVAAGALSSEQLLAISAFLVAERDPRARAPAGWVRGMSRFAVRDPVLPPFALRGRLSATSHLHVGFAARLTRLEIGAPIYDPNRGALLADRRGYGAALSKLYLEYETDEVTAIAGTFRAGFGQRLVFDSSRLAAPNGLYADDGLPHAAALEPDCREAAGELARSPCAGDAGGRFVTPDYRPREGLVGVAAGWKRHALGAGWLQAYAWVSAARRAMAQDELVDRGRCADPRADGEPDCDPPRVLVRPDGPILTPTSRLASGTLPDVFEERLAGVHVAYFADRRSAVGLTAYGASLRDLVDGVELDTQEWSRLPTGRRYGSIGAQFSLGRGWLDLAGEAALSLDRQPDDPSSPVEGGGGPAAIVRATATGPRQELEASVRYYGIDHANPYARPISQPDAFDGQRARDEAGARLRYAGAHDRLAIRALLDLWYPVSSLRDGGALGRSQPKLDGLVRADVRAARALWLGLWLRLEDQDLRESGPAQCFETSLDDLAEGEPIPCRGSRLTTAGQVRLEPGRTLSVTAQLEHQLLDDGQAMDSPFQDQRRRDLAGWLIALWQPDPDLRVRGRARYLHEAVNGGRDDLGERSLAALLAAAIVLRGRDVLEARVDVTRYLDEREATRLRSPNPEVQLWLSYEARL